MGHTGTGPVGSSNGPIALGGIMMMELQPTFVSVDMEILRRALDAVELGLEHTRTSLAEYDDIHGRAILRHRQWCETLEQHAAKLLRSRGELRTALGFRE